MIKKTEWLFVIFEVKYGLKNTLQIINSNLTPKSVLQYCLLHEVKSSITGDTLLRGYAVFNEPVNEQQLKDLLNAKRISLLIADDTFEQNYSYCTDPKYVTSISGPYHIGDRPMRDNDVAISTLPFLRYNGDNRNGSDDDNVNSSDQSHVRVENDDAFVVTNNKIRIEERLPSHYCKRDDDSVNDLATIRNKIRKGATKRTLWQDMGHMIVKYPDFINYSLEICREPKENVCKLPTVWLIIRPQHDNRMEKPMMLVGKNNYYNLISSTNGKVNFDNYDNQDWLLISDISAEVCDSVLLSLLDKYPREKRYSTSVVGKYVWCVPNNIVITSTYPLDDWHYDKHTKDLLKKLITVTIE